MEHFDNKASIQEMQYVDISHKGTPQQYLNKLFVNQNAMLQKIAKLLTHGESIGKRSLPPAMVFVSLAILLHWF